MERYQLSLHATELPNKGGWFRKSSPYAIVKVLSGKNAGKVIGETEAVEHNLSPGKYFYCKTVYLEQLHSSITLFVCLFSRLGENSVPGIFTKSGYKSRDYNNG